MYNIFNRIIISTLFITQVHMYGIPMT